MIYLKPLDEELLHEIGRKYNRIITVENGVIKGGFGSAVLEFMADNGYTPSCKAYRSAGCVYRAWFYTGTVSIMWYGCREHCETVEKGELIIVN